MRRITYLLGLCVLPCLLGGEELSVPSCQLYDRNGVPIRGLLSAAHTYYQPVTLDQLSPWLITATVAAEDKRFYAHNGVDVLAVVRAVWQNATGGEIVSGASTITQQLARTVAPRPKTWWGKTQEAARAVRLETQLTKEEILEQYFNRLEFGNLTQGVQAASRFYFSTEAADLSVSQAAFLAGLIKSPTYYNPLKHPARALKRRNYVLLQMYKNGFVDDKTYEQALAEEIVLRTQARPFAAPHWVAFVRPYLPAGVSEVHTTLDRALQEQVEQLVKTHLAQLADRHVTNAAVVVLENATGGILAYVGSADFNDAQRSGQVDGVRALRQPGSALKPFVYGAGFAQGKLTPATLLDDSDTFFEGGFRPRNYDENFHGAVTVRQALACSYNIPAVKAAEQIGVENILHLLHRAGISSLQKPAGFYGLGLALGNGEVRLLELAGAYAVLARGGVSTPLLLATRPRITLPGKVSRVFDEKTAYLLTDILKDNQARAAAFGLNSPLFVPFEMAAKTGTSKDYKDNWAIGYTPRWTIGVWVGNFDATPMQKVSGVTGAGPILHDVALYMQAHYPSVPFTPPAGLHRTVVCNQTGLLAGPRCAHTHEEVFDEKNRPVPCNGQHQTDVKEVRIISPQAGDKFMIDPAVTRESQQLKLAARCAQQACSWTVDGKPVPGDMCQTWWPLAPGRHTVAVQCAGQSAQTAMEVLE